MTKKQIVKISDKCLRAQGAIIRVKKDTKDEQRPLKNADFPVVISGSYRPVFEFWYVCMFWLINYA